MPDAVNPQAASRKVWNPVGIAWLTIVFSALAGGVLHALNERRLGREGSWRGTLYRNLFAGSLLLLPGLLVSPPGPGTMVSAQLFFAMYFYKTQAHLFEEHVAAGGAKARFWIPFLVTLAGSVLLIALFAR